MTIKEVLLNQQGEQVMARVLQPGSQDLALGYRTSEGTDPYDESLVVLNPDTIEVLRETIIRGGNIKEERRTLQGEAINDANLRRNVDTDRVSHIVWEASKSQ